MSRRESMKTKLVWKWNSSLHKVHSSSSYWVRARRISTIQWHCLHGKM